MSELKTSQQFHSLEAARDELARRQARNPRRAERVQRFFAEEAVLALVADHPQATRPAVQGALAGKPPKDPGLQTAVANAYRAGQHLTAHTAAGRDIEETLLPALHRLLFDGVDALAGHYRTGPTKPLLLGPPPMDAAFIPRALYNTYQWVGTASFTEIHPVEQAVLLCARLLEIQPFAAGNLKAVPLAASLPLLRHGFPPVLFPRAEHPAFLQALGLAFMLSMQPLIDLYTQALQRLLEEAMRRT